MSHERQPRKKAPVTNGYNPDAGIVKDGVRTIRLEISADPGVMSMRVGMYEGLGYTVQSEDRYGVKMSISQAEYEANQKRHQQEALAQRKSAETGIGGIDGVKVTRNQFEKAVNFDPNSLPTAEELSV